jgi:hypothetical protein
MAIQTRQYPRKVWVLMPSFKPVEVEVVGRYASYSNYDYGDQTAKGKIYAPDAMFQTKNDAIRAGREAVAKTEADLTRRRQSLNKKIAALDAAEKQ